MSDYFSQPGVADIVKSIICRWPLEDIQKLQLVNRDWRRIIASPDFGDQILGKDAIFLVSQDGCFVIHAQSLLKIGDRRIYTQRMFPKIKLPLLSIVGSCDGLICVKDRTNGLFVLNPRNLKYRSVVGSSVAFRAYGLGWKYGGYLRTTRFHVVVVLDIISPHVQKLRIPNLKTNKWSHQTIDYGKFDWKLESVANEGVFVKGIFAWMGRGIRDNRIFHSIVLYDGNTGVFDFIELPEC